MAPTTPKVSVGLPLYNEERRLRCTLDLLLDQTFADIEVILSDNASTDATEALCRDYVARDPRVRYLRNDVNLGSYRNFNRVFAAASGRYFVWVAAGDRWERDAVARAVEIMDRDPAVVLCYSAVKIADSEGNVQSILRDQFKVDSDSPAERLLVLVRELDLCNSFYGFMRRSALESTGLLRSDVFAADVVLLAEMALRGKFVQLDEPLFHRDRGKRYTRQERHARCDHVLFPAGTETVRLPYTRMIVRHLDIVQSSGLAAEEKGRLLHEMPLLFDQRFRFVLQEELNRAIGLAMQGDFGRRWDEAESAGPPKTLPTAVRTMQAAAMLRDLNEALIMYSDYPGLHMARAACLAALGRRTEAAATCLLEYLKRPDLPGLRDLCRTLGCLDAQGNVTLPRS